MKLPLSLALCAILSSSAFALPAFGPEHEPNPEIQRRTEWTSAFNYSVPRWEWWPSLGPLPTNPKGERALLESRLENTLLMQKWAAL